MARFAASELGADWVSERGRGRVLVATREQPEGDPRHDSHAIRSRSRCVAKLPAAAGNCALLRGTAWSCATAGRRISTSRRRRSSRRFTGRRRTFASEGATTRHSPTGSYRYAAGTRSRSCTSPSGRGSNADGSTSLQFLARAKSGQGNAAPIVEAYEAERQVGSTRSTTHSSSTGRCSSEDWRAVTRARHASARPPARRRRRRGAGAAIRRAGRRWTLARSRALEYCGGRAVHGRDERHPGIETRRCGSSNALARSSAGSARSSTRWARGSGGDSRGRIDEAGLDAIPRVRSHATRAPSLSSPSPSASSGSRPSAGRWRKGATPGTTSSTTSSSSTASAALPGSALPHAAHAARGRAAA